MRPTDAFISTVGVLLAENYPALPWRSPVPPALTSAHGWFMPTAAGPLMLFVLPTRGLDSREIAHTFEQWHMWLSSLQASESVLLLLHEEGDPPATSVVGPIEGARWPVWGVDLEGHRVERASAPDDRQPFAQTVDSLIGAFFKGARFTSQDLAEQEQARLDGKVPFFTFLDRQKAPATYALLVMIGLMFALTQFLGGSENMHVLLRAGANFRMAVAGGEFWRLVTANFLHIGYAHLAVNAYSLFAVGPMLEKLFGTTKFLAIYVFAGVTGALLSFFFNTHGISAGASGALFGLIGAMLVLGIRHQDAIPDHEKKRMRNVALVTLAINLAIGFQIPGIDNFCHIGGLMGGAAMGALLGPHPILLGRPPRPWLPPVLSIFPLVALAALAYGLVYTLSGHAPLIPMVGPTQDFVVEVADAPRADDTHSLYLLKDEKHQLIISSQPNPFWHAGKHSAALTEATLPAYADELARAIGASEKAELIGPALPYARGQRRYLKLVLRDPEGHVEEAYATAHGDRLFVIHTKGLDGEPWVRAELDQALASFEPATQPMEKPAP